MSERSIYFRDQADKCRQHANMVGDARTRELAIDNYSALAVFAISLDNCDHLR
jgi:hypothetical protein